MYIAIFFLGLSNIILYCFVIATFTYPRTIQYIIITINVFAISSNLEPVQLFITL